MRLFVYSIASFVACFHLSSVIAKEDWLAPSTVPIEDGGLGQASVERLDSIIDPSKDFIGKSDEDIIRSFCQHMGKYLCDKFVKESMKNYLNEVHTIAEQVRNKPNGTTAVSAVAKAFYMKIMKEILTQKIEKDLEFAWNESLHSQLNPVAPQYNRITMAPMHPSGKKHPTI